MQRARLRGSGTETAPTDSTEKALAEMRSQVWPQPMSKGLFSRLGHQRLYQSCCPLPHSMLPHQPAPQTSLVRVLMGPQQCSQEPSDQAANSSIHGLTLSRDKLKLVERRGGGPAHMPAALASEPHCQVPARRSTEQAITPATGSTASA